MPDPGGPPPEVSYTLDEADALLKALEDCDRFLDRLLNREPLTVLDGIGPKLVVEDQMSILRRKLGIGEGGTDGE